MKENKLQLRLLYPARISFKYEGEIKSLTDKQKLREFSTTKPDLQQMLKDLLQTGNTEKVSGFNTPLTPMDRSTKQKICKETQTLNDGVKTISLTSGAGKTGQPLVKE